MDERSRIRLGVHQGMLALFLLASCGSRALDADGGSIDGPGTGRAGAGGGVAGIGGPGFGGQAGSVGPVGSGGISSGTGGFSGVGGRGGAIGSGGVVGSGGISGRGGISGSIGSGGVGGRGGISGSVGSGGISGRGGISGSIGSGGISGRGGATGGSGAIGGSILGVAGTQSTGGRGGIAGTSDLGGRGGVGGTFATGGTAVIAGRGGSGGTGGIGGSGGSVCLTCWAAVLPVAAQDIVYSAARNEIYASVSGEADTYPNRIVVINPTTSSIVSTIAIGSNPNKLGISDDGLTLWVGIDGAHAIRKVALDATPPTVGPLMRLPKSSPTYFDAGAMAVLPGMPLSVVIALGNNGYSGDVRVFDDGVQRGTGPSNSYLVASSLVAGPPGIVFGGSPGQLFVMRVSSSGVSQSTFFGLIRNYSSNIVYTGNRVFTDNGDVVDVSNPNSPFRTTSLPYQGVVALRDPMSVLMLTTTSGTTFPFTPRSDVRIYVPSSLAQIGQAAVPASVTSTVPYFRKMVYAGGDAVAILGTDYTGYTPNSRIAIVHDPALGMPMGGAGGAVGVGGAGGAGGTGGAAGAPNLCPGCSVTSVPAYGLHMAPDPGRNLIYVAANAQAPVHPSTIVTVDSTAGAVTSFVPVGNDPQPVALSDDGSILWVGLGDRRVRRMTPGTTPIPGTAYPLPMLLTTNEPPVPASIVALPGTPASIAVSVYGQNFGGRGVFILDDGLPRANFIQPPEVSAYFLTNGPPGYLLGTGDSYNLVAFRISTVGATYESYTGLTSGYQTGLAYSAGLAFASSGEVIDLSNPDNPQLAGRFNFAGCLLAMRRADRVMMLCPNSDPRGPVLRVLDPATFTSVGSVILPLQASPYYGQTYVDFAYLGGDAVAALGYGTPLQIIRAPLIGNPP